MERDTKNTHLEKYEKLSDLFDMEKGWRVDSAIKEVQEQIGSLAVCFVWIRFKKNLKNAEKDG